MDVELVTLASVPIGLVSCILIHGKDKIDEEVPSKAGEVLVSVCPSGRLIAFISCFKAHFVASEGFPDLHKEIYPTYQNSFEGLLAVVRDPTKPKPHATACVVLPMVLELRPGSPQMSSVVVVGFSDGFIRGYSKTGKSIFAKQLHTSQVTRLSVMAPPANLVHVATSQPGSLLVLFQGGCAVCIVDGVSLATVVQENVLRINEGDIDVLEPVLLSHKKYHLEQQVQTNDIAYLGPSTPSFFDHLCDASWYGYETSVKTGPLPEAKLLSVGEQPMVALYRINKDSGTLNVSEVVHAVASKMTSAVLGKLSQASGWLGWGGGKASSSSSASSMTASSPSGRGKQQEEKPQPTVNLRMSTNIPDPRREVSSVVVSPLSNLAALVDGFGRVLLLDTSSLIIRRMWKGYREAQCGWLLVEDPSDPERKAQCLCIYAPRRGLVELWPVQFGARVAVFQVGKGCRLLYSQKCAFGSEYLLKTSSLANSGLGNSALLLSPTGQLIRFYVPFPALVKLSDAQSHDTHLMQQLDCAMDTGNDNLTQQIASSVKSSLALQEVIDTLIASHSSHTRQVNRELILKVVNIALCRTISDETYPVPLELRHKMEATKKLCQLYFDVLDIQEQTHNLSREVTPNPEMFPELLQSYCYLSGEAVQRLSFLLANYFQGCSSEKQVWTRPTLAELIFCFDAGGKGETLDYLLPPERKAVGEVVEVELRLQANVSEKQECELGLFLFRPLLISPLPTRAVMDLFSGCAVPPSQLMVLLMQCWLQGYSDVKPALALQQLHRVFKALQEIDPATFMDNGAAETWTKIHSLLSCTHRVGHALLAALLCQNLACNDSSPPVSKKGQSSTAFHPGEDDNEEDGWESVSVEKEKWVRLCEHLELLTQVAALTGMDALKKIPPVLFLTTEDDEEEDSNLNLSQLQMQMLFEEDGQSLSVSTLESTGPSLIGHCIGRCMVVRQAPAKLITIVTSKVVMSGIEAPQHTLSLLQPLVQAMPLSLSPTRLLLYSAFHAALEWKQCMDAKQTSILLSLALGYICKIPSVKLAQGMCGFLWHMLLQKEVSCLMDALKKTGSCKTGRAMELLWNSRSLINFLFDLSCCGSMYEEDADHDKKDIFEIHAPGGLQFLPTIIKLFPAADSQLLSSCLQLLLLMEIALECSNLVNVLSYFLPYVRNWMRKGLFLCKGQQETVSKHLKVKRLKFLCGAVSVELQEKEPSVKPSAVFDAAAGLPLNTRRLFVLSRFSDLVFTLAVLWELKPDEVKISWVADLFATGKHGRGKELYQSIEDKEGGSVTLLAVVGHLMQLLITAMDKTLQTTLFSQISPNILSWMRKQASVPVVSSLIKPQPSLKSVSLLLSTIHPFLGASSSEEMIAIDLKKVEKWITT